MGAIVPAVSLVREERACMVLQAEVREPSKRRTRDSVWRVDAMNAADAWVIALLMPRPPKETGRDARSQVEKTTQNFIALVKYDILFWWHLVFIS